MRLRAYLVKFLLNSFKVGATPTSKRARRHVTRLYRWDGVFFVTIMGVRDLLVKVVMSVYRR